jgi:hypothetical protein
MAEFLRRQDEDFDDASTDIDQDAMSVRSEAISPTTVPER